MTTYTTYQRFSHGKSDEYGVLILAGGDIKKKLEFWNQHIPDLKQFIVSSCERIVVAQRKG